MTCGGSGTIDAVYGRTIARVLCPRCGAVIRVDATPGTQAPVPDHNIRTNAQEALMPDHEATHGHPLATYAVGPGCIDCDTEATAAPLSDDIRDLLEELSSTLEALWWGTSGAESLIQEKLDKIEFALTGRHLTTTPSGQPWSHA